VAIALTLPWRWASRSRPERALLFASRFDATGLKDRWRLLVGAAGLRPVVLNSPGALGVSLRVEPFAGRFYTLSMWADEASLKAFAHDEPHRRAVRSVRGIGPVQGILVSRPARPVRPDWTDAVAWVDGCAPGSYRWESASS